MYHLQTVDWGDYGCVFWMILYGFVCAAAACCLVRLAWYSISWTWVAVFLTFSIGKVVTLPKWIPRNTDIRNSSCRCFSPLPDPRHHPTPVLRAERLGHDVRTLWINVGFICVIHPCSNPWEIILLRTIAALGIETTKDDFRVVGVVTQIRKKQTFRVTTAGM
ncbi:hypothetical protein EDD15DRAFT_2196034 [Pisolithus albus]|nr:hypothetical protein EDD15DRAFT_2196034 [Pisolithus albus]